MLSFSSIPVLHGIGMTVAIGAFLSLVFSAMLGGRNHRGARPWLSALGAITRSSAVRWRCMPRGAGSGRRCPPRGRGASGRPPATMLLLTVTGLWPRSALLGPEPDAAAGANARLGQVGLCFDDGPDPEVTPAVLDLLDAHGAKASFFCIAERAARHPGLVRDIVAGGHTVENHTWQHPRRSRPSGCRRDPAGGR